jgi:hexosaminidase
LHQTALDPSNIANPHDGDIDESYSLDVTASGDVTITGASSFGIAHGLTTFTQLFYQTYAGSVYTTLAPVSITDAPLFPHRGMNMDLSRNWFAMSDIERMIDALAYNKFNRMHLHITDSQSWPLQIPSLPDLAAKGAYRSDLTYSPAQIQQIQYYGFLQGVSVYLEIDSPGHSASIAYAYPDLIASFNIQPDWDDYAAEPPSGTLKLNSSAVYDFMNTLYGDLLSRISPWSAYFHSGGDEVNQNAYLNDDTVRSNDTSVLQPLIQKFVNRNHDQIRANGMTPVVWEEMLLTWNLTLGSDVIVQTWESDESVASTTAQGHYALAGNYNFWVSSF